MLASFPASTLNHIHAKKGIPYRFILGQKDSKAQSREYTIARKALAAQSFGVTPNLMAMAKALTNGTVPMGAVAVRDTMYETVTGAAPAGAIKLYQGYTHSG